jgi:hypothetical protein
MARLARCNPAGAEDKYKDLNLYLIIVIAGVRRFSIKRFRAKQDVAKLIRIWSRPYRTPCWLQSWAHLRIDV